MRTRRLISVVLSVCIVTTVSSSAQTFTTLLNFAGANGAAPYAGLVQGTDGSFYGTTQNGGANGFSGTVFKITPEGKLTTLYNFCSQALCSDGSYPEGTLVQATNGKFYGTTFYGGFTDSSCQPGCGTVFEITAAGELTTLYTFCKQSCSDGARPMAGLIQANDGDLYGTASEGGANSSGTVFKITPEGKLTTLYSFCVLAGCADGSAPMAELIQARDGNFYGTTFGGGSNGISGTVFRITANGKLTTLHSFDGGADGEFPYAGLVQATDGNFYGTTNDGGMYYGTVFKITPTGKLTTLASFCPQPWLGCPNGAFPTAGLVQGTDGNFYGTTTNFSGSKTLATVFRVSFKGKFNLLHQFDGADGALPYAGLIQATNGNFYGTTYGGGRRGDGGVFGLDVGLGPFVEIRPTSGKAGTSVIVLGNNLRDSTSVTFNGTSATFTVISNTEIRATVPPAATTGSISVTTLAGTLSSNVFFLVRP